MAFGYAPYTRDPLDSIIESRLASMAGQPTDTMLRLSPLDARQMELPPEPSQEPKKQSYLAGLASRLFSPEGLTSFGAGLAASQRGRNPLEALGLGLAESGRSREGFRARKFAEDEARKRSSQPERDLRADEARKILGQVDAWRQMRLSEEDIKAKLAGRGTEQGDTTAARNYASLIKLRVEPEKALKMAYGELSSEKPATVPQGQEDVTAIMQDYGVAENTARMIKMSGAIRIRPGTTTTAPNPYTGKMETRTTESQQIPLKRGRQLQAEIGAMNNVEGLKALVNGEVPDDAPEDEGLHRNIQLWAMQRLSQLQRPAEQNYISQEQQMGLR